ncbi:lysine--tRNA ligase [Candidatus Micrarchaeota archaeon]|nr:lysine--tRNA ligase [Candidatus Micrarchaeota archaeon]
MHWADQLAEKIIERAGKEGGEANVKCQQTPSGGKHIGNLNDVARAYFPFKAAEKKGLKITFVHTTDDRDPLKDVPLKLPDLQGKFHLSKDLMDMAPYLGMPLCRVPDPFKCCKNWSAHFTKVWMDGVNLLGMHPTLYYVNKLYEEGKFEPYILKLFEKVEKAGKLVAKFQATKSENYIPFDAICSSCGRLANIDSFDLKTHKVHFVCGGKSIKAKKSEGCGFIGEVDWKEGKLQWRFEWPALWGIFKTTYEPFGKDHFEGSWKSGMEIMREIYDLEPPIPFVYEFFLVNGQKMSASKGNVYLVQDMLKIMEPEAFLFYYTKRPEKQRDLELSRIWALLDEFDSAEKVYFGKEQERTENRDENTKRMYELAVEKKPDEYSRRIPYQFGASIVQLFNEEQCIAILKRMNHVETEKEVELAKARLKLCKNWVELYAPLDAKVHVLSENEAKAQLEKLSANQIKSLQQFGEYYQKERDSDKQQEEIKKIALENSISIQDFFKAAYQIFIGKERGPKLLPFLDVQNRDFVTRRLNGSG